MCSIRCTALLDMPGDIKVVSGERGRKNVLLLNTPREAFIGIIMP